MLYVYVNCAYELTAAVEVCVCVCVRASLHILQRGAYLSLLRSVSWSCR